MLDIKDVFSHYLFLFPYEPSDKIKDAIKHYMVIPKAAIPKNMDTNMVYVLPIIENKPLKFTVERDEDDRIRTYNRDWCYDAVISSIGMV